MNNSCAERRFAIGEESRPTFPRYARLHQDRTRRRLVILAPERVYEVDAIGAAVLKLCDGERRVADIVSELAAIYSAPADVIAIDGKTLRRSYQKKGAKAPIHKSNEIVAIRALLDMIAIEGAS